MKLEEKLVLLRKEKGLSQLKLAEIMNVSRQAISRWEVGLAVPSTNNLQFLSKLYGVSIDYLMNEENKYPEQSKEASEENRKSECRKKREQKTLYINNNRKIKIWLLIIIVVVVLMTVGVLNNAIAFSLIVAMITGIISIAYLLEKWIIHIVLCIKNKQGR